MATSSEFVVRSAMLTVKRREGMQRYKTFWAAILIGGLVGGGEFGATAAVGPATEAVRKTVDEVIRILEDPEWKKPEKKEERRKLLEQTIAQRFNFLEMSRRSLGAEWNKRTPEEQKDFAASFQTLLANTYLGRIETYSGGEKVQYLKEIVDGEYADVYTKLDNGKTAVDIMYKMEMASGDWRVYDVVVEGTGLVQNDGVDVGVIVPYVLADDEQRVTKIIAPMFIHNEFVGSRAAINVFEYPTRGEEYRLIASYTERTERKFLYSYRNLFLPGGRFSLEA